MIFKFLRQIRLAAIVVQFTGLALTNYFLIILGTLVFFVSYMFSIQHIEQFYIELEDRQNAKKKEQKAERERQKN